MKKVEIIILLIILKSAALFASNFTSVTVKIKLVNGEEYQRCIVESFPDNFVYSNQTLTNYFKNINRDSIFISNDIIVDANGSLLRFSEQSSCKSISPKDVKKIHLISKYEKPVPMGSTLVTKEEFNVLSKKLNALYYFSPDKISKSMKLGFLFLSFGESSDLKYYVDEFQSVIDKSIQTNNIDNVVIRSASIKKEVLKKNIYLYYNISQ